MEQHHVLVVDACTKPTISSTMGRATDACWVRSTRNETPGSGPLDALRVIALVVGLPVCSTQTARTSPPTDVENR